MSARNILMAAAGAQPSLNVADVFSAYPYSGTGAAQSLSPGVDLSTYGGLFWSKTRATTGGHRLFDSERGNNYLDTSSIAAQAGNTGVSPTTSGVNLAIAGSVNASGYTYIGWMFRKAAKFFDVVPYTGDGTSTKTVAHSLGTMPGIIVVKRTDSTGNWVVWHRSLSTDTVLMFHTTHAAFGVSAGTFSSVGASSFSVGHPTNQPCNESGSSYVAYLFAHDDSASGIVQCGSVTTAADGTASITLGWQPQYLLWKSATNAVAWQVADTARGWVGGGNNNNLLTPNSTATETTGNGAPGTPTETGINFVAEASQTLIYMAIRAA